MRFPTEAYVKNPGRLRLSGPSGQSEENWLPGQDSNLGQRIQSPLCYRYTTGQCESGDELSVLATAQPPQVLFAGLKAFS